MEEKFGTYIFVWHVKQGKDLLGEIEEMLAWELGDRNFIFFLGLSFLIEK